jgi:hypothetical protein
MLHNGEIVDFYASLIAISVTHAKRKRWAGTCSKPIQGKVERYPNFCSEVRKEI